MNGIDEFDVVEMRPGIEPIIFILASSTPVDPQYPFKRVFIVESDQSTSIFGGVREETQDYHRRITVSMPVSALTAQVVGELNGGTLLLDR